jgi:hypothetical protein
MLYLHEAMKESDAKHFKEANDERSYNSTHRKWSLVPRSMPLDEQLVHTISSFFLVCFFFFVVVVARPSGPRCRGRSSRTTVVLVWQLWPLSLGWWLLVVEDQYCSRVMLFKKHS